MRRDVRLLGLLLASVAILPIAAARPVWAQSKSAPNIDEIVVTGTKTGLLITQVPQTVSVVTRDEMDLRGVQDLNKALSYTPGIRFRDYPGQQGMQEFFMRGFRVNNTAGSVFRDGLRQQFNNLDGDIETYGLERIELLKGPASVLYGQVAPGGLVNVFTKHPTDEAMGEIELQTGSFARKQVAADVGGPIGDSDQYLYRLTGLFRDAGTQFDYTDDNRRYIAPAFTWKDSDRTSLTVLAQYFKTQTGSSDQSFPTKGTIFSNPNGVIPRNRFLGEPAANLYQAENVNLGYEFKLGIADGLDFEQKLRFTASNLKLYGLNVSNSAVLHADNRTLDRIGINRHAHSNSFLTDAHLAWTTSVASVEATTLLGVDYAWWRRTNVQVNGTVGPLDVFTPVYGQPITWGTTAVSNSRQGLSQTGIYGQLQLRWQGLNVTGGLREDWVDQTSLNRNNNAASVLNPSALTGRVGLLYELPFGLSPYASYSTSFQPLAGATFAGTTFTPVTGTQYEAGLKYEPMPNVLITGAIYQLTQQNISTPDIAHPGFFVQQGAVRSKGGELEVQAKLMEINFTLAYAYTYATVTKANPNAAGVTILGLKQLAIPANTLSLFANREFPIGPGALNIGAGVRAVSGSFNPNNTVKTSGYGIVDALIEYKLNKWSLGLNVDNLLDKTYFTPGFYDQSVFYGYERNFLVTLKYHW